MILVAALTWVLPSGQYDTVEKDGRNYTVAGSYHAVASNPQGLSVLMAPAKGFSKCADIIVFIFITGAIFTILERTGTVNAVIMGTSYLFSRRESLKKWFIPASMLLFSLGGSVFGMEEETLIFIPLFIPLALSLGYDSVVGVSIPFLGAWVGFCAAFMNPFTVGISQGIAQLPLYSGLGYRVAVWAVCTAVVIGFVMWYGEKIRKNPAQSLTYQADQKRRQTLDLTAARQKPSFEKKHLFISVLFALGMILLVIGVACWEWYIYEISALFLGVGLICALVGRLRINQTTDAIIDGARSMVSVAVMLALARGIVVIADDGHILATVLHAVVSAIGHLHPLGAVEGMFWAHSFLNFFIASGSGQAVLTMPVMIPLSDLMHISPQLAILAYQFGEGWTNAIIPTAPVTMAALGMAGIPWLTWAKWNIKLQLILAVLSMLLLIPPYLSGW